MTSIKRSIMIVASPYREKMASLCIGPTIAAALVMLTLTSTCPPSQAEKKDDDRRLDVYLMDRIARKSYLNYHSAVASSSTSTTSSSTSRNQQQQHHNAGDAFLDNGRPKGVPSKLRILTIDVPDFKRDAFQRGAICQLPLQVFPHTLQPSSSLEFSDGIAPSKPMNKTLGHNERTGTRDSRKPILQKSLAKQLYYCYYPNDVEKKNRPVSTTHRQLEHPAAKQSKKMMSSTKLSNDIPPSIRIGAVILETSVMDLNPNNLQRFYTSTSRKYRYDQDVINNAGATVKLQQDDDDASGIADAEEAEIADVTLEQTMNNKAVAQQQLMTSQLEEKDIDDPDYERTAPWNQYAWLEEMHLRIHGLVPFGAPMQRAPIVSQWLYGRVYHQSIPISTSSWLSWIRWPTWGGTYAVGSPRYRKSWDGVDGKGESTLFGEKNDSGDKNKHFFSYLISSKTRNALNRASNKPHAVICDGSALQRVPGSLRYLSKLCREAGIPLYVLNDPRTWGSQTHSTLSDAIVDMRKSITQNVVHHALDLREGAAFERGRFVGRLEKEVAWQAYDAARKIRDNLVEARRKLRRDKPEDWSELSAEDLSQQLIDRKVITPKADQRLNGVTDVGTDSMGQSNTCSNGFAILCRQYGTGNKVQPTSDKSSNETD